MAETPKQTDGRVVDVRGLPFPVTDAGTFQRAQCELLDGIWQELRGIRAALEPKPDRIDVTTLSDSEPKTIEKPAPPKPRQASRKKASKKAAKKS